MENKKAPAQQPGLHLCKKTQRKGCIVISCSTRPKQKGLIKL